LYAEGLQRDLKNLLKLILAASDADMTFAMDFSSHSINSQLSFFHRSFCIAALTSYTLKR